METKEEKPRRGPYQPEKTEIAKFDKEIRPEGFVHWKEDGNRNEGIAYQLEHRGFVIRVEITYIPSKSMVSKQGIATVSIFKRVGTELELIYRERLPRRVHFLKNTCLVAIAGKRVFDELGTCPVCGQPLILAKGDDLFRGLPIVTCPQGSLESHQGALYPGFLSLLEISGGDPYKAVKRRYLARKRYDVRKALTASGQSPKKPDLELISRPGGPGVD